VATDQLSVAIPKVTVDPKVTKQSIASYIGRVYDLLGFFTPVINSGKILLRQLW